MVVFSASTILAAAVLPVLAGASMFALATATVPITSYLMGYNYLRGTATGFADFVDGPKNRPRTDYVVRRRYKNWWY